MSRISWGTMRKALGEAEIALRISNPSIASQRLGKAVRYIYAINEKVSLQPRRFAPIDIERLQQVVQCLKQTDFNAREKRENLPGYLAQGKLAVEALQQVTRTFTRGTR